MLLVEAQTGKDDRRPRWRGVGIDREEPFVDVAEQVRVGACLRLLEQASTLDVTRQHRIEGRDLAAGRFLRDIASPRATGHLDRTLVRIELAGQCLHQGGLIRDGVRAALSRFVD